MATARIRNYAKKNEERVNGWRDKYLRLHILRELDVLYSGRDEKGIRPTEVGDIVDTRGQVQIGRDILYEHFDLAQGYIQHNQWGQKSCNLRVIHPTFLEMIKGKAVKPSLNLTDKELTTEDDIYVPLQQLKLEFLVYVFENQDEHTFRFCTNKRSGGTRYELCVLDKVLEDEADNLSFRNSIDKYYIRKAGQVSWGMFGKSAPDLDNFTTEYGVSGTYMSYNFVGVHNALLPDGIKDLNSKKMTELVDLAQQQVDVLTRTLEQLKVLRDSILEAEAGDGVEDLYYQQMIAHFTQAVPLLVNSEDEEIKEMARRLAKKHFY